MPTASHTWVSYLRWFLISFILAISAAGALNIFIDPLGVFAAPRITGLNAIKPHLDHHREFARYQNAVRVCADTGIFGNSRAEIGLDPENKALVAHKAAAFNHAIPGTGPQTTYQQILWLEAANCLPKTIILGVDFFDFLGGAARNALPTLQTSPPPQLNRGFFADSVFSIAGLGDSLATILAQHSHYPATTTDRGFNPLLNYIPEVGKSGAYIFFRQRAEENIRRWRQKPLRLRPEQGGASDDEATLDAILARLSRADTTIYVIIYPYHAQIRVLAERLGMGELFADWKQLLISIAERNARPGVRIEVWDFSAIAPETIEAIPPKGDRQTRLNYYWEGGHFKNQLGDRVLERLLGKPGDFGVKLDSGNIERWVAEDRSRVRSFIAADGPLNDEVDDLLKSHGGNAGN